MQETIKMQETIFHQYSCFQCNKTIYGYDKSIYGYGYGFDCSCCGQEQFYPIENKYDFCDWCLGLQKDRDANEGYLCSIRDR